MTPVERRGTEPDTMKGSDYRALRRIADVTNHTLANVGDTCQNVPAAVLPSFLASGKIERATERRETPGKTRRREDR